MEVLIFQIAIFFIILISGYYGNYSRNIVTILLVIFTIVMVFTTKLMVIQFLTIGVAYFISTSSKSKTSQKSISPDKDEWSNGQTIGCFVFVILLFFFLMGGVLEIIKWYKTF